MITLTRVTHKSSAQIETNLLTVRASAIIAFQDELVVVGNHQFNVQEDRETIQKLIDAEESNYLWH